VRKAPDEVPVNPARPRNWRKSLTLVGTGQLAMEVTLEGRAWMPSGVIMWPRKSTVVR
jgi:hypothetical protein